MHALRALIIPLCRSRTRFDQHPARAANVNANSEERSPKGVHDSPAWSEAERWVSRSGRAFSAPGAITRTSIAGRIPRLTSEPRSQIPAHTSTSGDARPAPRCTASRLHVGCVTGIVPGGLGRIAAFIPSVPLRSTLGCHARPSGSGLLTQESHMTSQNVLHGGNRAEQVRFA